MQLKKGFAVFVLLSMFVFSACTKQEKPEPVPTPTPTRSVAQADVVVNGKAIKPHRLCVANGKQVVFRNDTAKPIVVHNDAIDGKWFKPSTTFKTKFPDGYLYVYHIHVKGTNKVIGHGHISVGGSGKYCK